MFVWSGSSAGGNDENSVARKNKLSAKRSIGFHRWGRFWSSSEQFFFISKVVVVFPVQLWLDSGIMGDCFADWDQRCFFVLEVSLLCVCAVDRGGWFYFQGLLLWTLVLSFPEELRWLRALDALDCKLLVDMRLGIWPAVNTHTCKQYWGVPKWWDFFTLLYSDSWLQSAWWVNFIERKYGISIRKDGLTHSPILWSRLITGLQWIHIYFYRSHIFL